MPVKTFDQLAEEFETHAAETQTQLEELKAKVAKTDAETEALRAEIAALKSAGRTPAGLARWVSGDPKKPNDPGKPKLVST